MNRIPYMLCLLAVCSCTAADEVREYISASWDSTVRVNREDDGTLLGLPCPYTVPCPEGTFQEMYYWDTFFTNEGLLRDSRADLAAGNVENVMALVDRYGYMPNGTRTWYLNRSQPPYLAWMVESVYEFTGDTLFLSRACKAIEKEYAFWTDARGTSIGLSSYSSSVDDALAEEFVMTASKRLRHDFAADCHTRKELLKAGRHFAAEAESGWDFNPRFLRRCADFCPVDLNANLYHYEILMERFSQLLHRPDAEMWKERAAERKYLILKYMRADDGLFYDYDYVNGKRSDVVSAAVFNLLAAGVPDEEDAGRLIEGSLEFLEHEWGIAMCAEGDYSYDYQWSYPYGWAPGAYMAVRGLDRYGYRDAACRIAAKYVDAISRIYKATGTLWEKYDVTDLNKGVDAEYETPQMLGWSAGTYVYLTEYLKTNKRR